MRRSQIEIGAVAGGTGAEIGNVDVSQDLDQVTIGDIRQGLLDRCVIFFRGQELSAQRQKALTRRFGEIFLHPTTGACRRIPRFCKLPVRPATPGSSAKSGMPTQR